MNDSLVCICNHFWIE